MGGIMSYYAYMYRPDIFGFYLSFSPAFFFYKKLVHHMTQLVHNETVSAILCFVLIFVIVFLIVKIIQTILSKVFDGEIMKGLDRSLGFF